ncbi:hypothetical protein EKO04_009431 [Ascochyta lentis]|uniref:Uncharacterized protein n=1 Tax=Ascochyta lentis TaxID=205686 RepID=A0A8H7IZS1_9PLEO|nr:hypothetical protein EKO04_009431 [Ascochyta lentis]
MPIIQHAPSVTSFDFKSPGPPPYTMGSQQLSAPTPAPASNAFVQQPVLPGGYSQTQPQYHMQPQAPLLPSSQGQAQQSHFDQPQHQSPPIPQAYHGMPNMTSQQAQQVQQVIQNMPPEKLQMMQQQAQMMSPQPPPAGQYQPSPPPYQSQQQQPLQRPSFTTTAPSGLFGSKRSSSSGQSGPQDAQQTDKVKRFFGDTLFGRVARSSVSTATSFAKMPLSLSPWGDNNPVTLPNVRYRDAVLFTTFAFVGGPLVDGAADSITSAFGVDSFVSELVNSGAGAIAASTVLKYSVFQIVEQALDKGILEHMLPEEEKMLVTTEVKSLQVGVKHKLMGVDADLRFVGVQPARDSQAIEKGWFCPYLFASARTPSIPRANDFAIAQCFGPLLGGDYHLAHTLLSTSTHTLSLCPSSPTIDLTTNRLLILFTSISPYRATLWSTSRRPGCATLTFHLLSGCPALVLPVLSNAPLVAWSPWTLSQMRDPQSGYSAPVQHEQICEFLDTVVSRLHLSPQVSGRFEDVLARCVSLVVNGALATERCGGVEGMGKVDPARAGVVMFRY